MDFILHIDKYLANLIDKYHGLSYLLICGFIFVETGLVILPFIPGDSLLFAAGALVAAGNTGLDIWLLGLLLIIAAIAGNTLNYFIGIYLGPKIFKPENKVLRLEYYEQTQQFFNQYGGKAVIFSRFFPILRTIAPFVAGVGKMPFPRYNLYNFLGGIGWITTMLGCGYFFGNLAFVKSHFSVVVVAIVCISLIPIVYTAIKKRKTTGK